MFACCGGCHTHKRVSTWVIQKNSHTVYRIFYYFRNVSADITNRKQSTSVDFSEATAFEKAKKCHITHMANYIIQILNHTHRLFSWPSALLESRWEREFCVHAVSFCCKDARRAEKPEKRGSVDIRTNCIACRELNLFYHTLFVTWFRQVFAILE
jgi:hypothetical protein